MKIELTNEIITAAAQDAGTRSARKHGRAHWSQADYNEACRVQAELLDKFQAMAANYKNN